MDLEEILKIPINENHEPLISIIGKGLKVNVDVDHYLHLGTNDHYVRKSLIERLHEANQQLKRSGYELIILDAYRTPEQQASRYNSYQNDLAKQYLHLTSKQIIKESSAYTAQPRGNPPHTTGGAVNVTLLYEGKNADMGSHYGVTDTRAPTASTFLINNEQYARRQLLKQAMEHAGFTNNPAKWWHYSYGDQAWAAANKTAAIYGTVTKHKQGTKQ